MKHSSLGITSCILFGVVLLCLLGTGVALPQATAERHIKWVALFGFWLLGAWIALLGTGGLILSVVVYCLGLLGLFQSQCKKATATTGLILNGLSLLLFVYIMLRIQSTDAFRFFWRGFS